MARKQREALARVLPVYREFGARGQIEISTTPFYHPILPLICDSDIGAVSSPGLPLPPRFAYPDDAREQLDRARSYIYDKLGVAPVGLWPSEGSVSDEALALAAHAGFTWAASDNGVLARTLNRDAGVDVTYRAYKWQQNGHADANDLPRPLSQRSDRLRIFPDERCTTRPDIFWIAFAKTHSGRECLVPIILDGENAWEWYEANGRPFLRELYRRISEDPSLEALTVSEALAKFKAEPLHGIFPGSWINANFNVWIGAEEDNQAWDAAAGRAARLRRNAGRPGERAQTGLRRTAHCRGQRLELVVWSGARLRQSSGVRSALSRPSDQRLSRAGAGPARGALPLHPSHRAEPARFTSLRGIPSTSRSTAKSHRISNGWALDAIVPTRAPAPCTERRLRYGKCSTAATANRWRFAWMAWTKE